MLNIILMLTTETTAQPLSNILNPLFLKSMHFCSQMSLCPLDLNELFNIQFSFSLVLRGEGQEVLHYRIGVIIVLGHWGVTSFTENQSH